MHIKIDIIIYCLYCTKTSANKYKTGRTLLVCCTE